MSLKKKKVNTVLLVVYVDSGSASTSIVVVGKDGVGSIVATAQDSISFERRTDEQLKSAVAGTITLSLQKVLTLYKNIKTKRLVLPKEVHVIVGAPWVNAESTTAVKIFDKPTVITDQILNSIAQEAHTLATEIKNDALLESSIIRVELNGYPTGKPIGKRSCTVKTIVLSSDIDPLIKSSISNAITTVLPQVPMSFYSDARMLLVLSAHLYETPKSFIIIDIGMEHTYCLVMRENIVSNRVVLNDGLRTLINKIANGKTVEETIALLRMVEREQSSNDASETLIKSMALAEPEMLKSFGLALSQVSGGSRLPNQMILSTPASILPWMTKFFQRIDFSQFTQTAQVFSIETVTSVQLKQFILVLNAADPDAHALLSSAFVMML